MIGKQSVEPVLNCLLIPKYKFNNFCSRFKYISLLPVVMMLYNCSLLGTFGFRFYKENLCTLQYFEEILQKSHVQAILFLMLNKSLVLL